LQAPAQFSRVFWFLSHTCPLVQTKVQVVLSRNKGCAKYIFYFSHADRDGLHVVCHIYSLSHFYQDKLKPK